MSVHPAFEAYLAELNPLVQQAVAAGFEPTPASARAALASLNQFAGQDTQVERVFDSAIAGIPVRVYVPNPGDTRDVIFFVHGGGHMAGDLDVYDFSARKLADASGMVVVSVDYALAPEAPYPIGLEQTYAVLRKLPEGIPGVLTTGRVHGFADSGGGAKLASITQRAAGGSWKSPIDRQVLLYPSLDYTMAGQTITTYATDYFLSAERIRWYFDNYFAGEVDRAAASPVNGPFSADMPETLVIAAEYDPLLSEAVTYVERAQQAGAPIHLLVVPGMIHAFAFFETLIPEVITELYAVSAQFLTAGSYPTQWPTG